MTQDPLFLVSINLFAAFLARSLSRNLFTAVLLAVVVISSGFYLGTQHEAQIMSALNEGRDRLLAWTAAPPTWPPVLNEPYPDLVLLDQDGNRTKLSDFRGKVVLLEPVGVSCPACIAFSGGRSFDGVRPQANLESAEVYLRRFGGVDLNDPRIVFVQLVLFDQNLQPPTADLVARWADHFGFRREENRIVLGGTTRLADQAGMQMIPGFQLIDKQSILRYDSTGHAPRHDFYTELLPSIRELVEE